MMMVISPIVVFKILKKTDATLSESNRACILVGALDR
jgi:hypothetical protein